MGAAPKSEANTAEGPMEASGRRFWNTLSETYRLPWWLRLSKICPPMQETWVRSLVLEDPLEKVMATHFSILA